MIGSRDASIAQATMEPSRPDFCHPYTPYKIQLDFMRDLYRCIEDKKVGIFESPTGTGKSLSLICGALTWLRDHKRRDIDQMFQNTEDDGTDWLAEAEKAVQRREWLYEREELERKLAKIREEDSHRQRKEAESRVVKRQRVDNGSKTTREEEEDFMLEDYQSDDDDKQVKHVNESGSVFSSATQALLDKLKPMTVTGEDELQEETKLIFCSRTHSQLTQFVNELRRVKPPSSMSHELQEDDERSVVETVKHLSLGSRKNLCINPKVSRLSATTAMNERCIELQKPGTPKDQKCQYLPTKDDKERVQTFRDRVIAQIRDIEDIGKLGRAMELCPYYASRSAIAPSEVVTLPYPLLLQKSAREALGVSVKDNIVVIDEAHNLMDAIADTFSTSLRLSQFDLATTQVTAYVQKFKNRLKGGNRVYVTQVIRLLMSITDCLRSTMASSKQPEVAISVGNLMSGKGVDQIRPHKLLHYLQESKLAHKVEGYAEQVSNAETHKGLLMHFQNFLAVLMNPAAEGRFFVLRDNQDAVLRYTLLDPREHFRSVVEEARAVILAGGTMSPMSDYADYLFSYLDGRLQMFSFGHVIPRENLYAQAVVRGPSGVEFDFTYQKRKSEAMILELGGLLLRTCRMVPDGVVVFFPSYDYLAQVVAVWKNTIMEEISRHKVIFEESKGVSVDDLLREYAQAIDNGKGGLMLSVVGGKLSEGINFSDRLGRVVVAVGLPFPNINGAEWKSKIEHVEQLRYEQCRSTLSDMESKSQAKAAGRDYYENACMRAVNQSIGRAIRHKNDYAAILLVDRRFATERISKKLPQWIRNSMAKEDVGVTWVEVEGRLRSFFETKQ